MSSFLFSSLAFVVTLGILITAHEYGHFWVARKLGVKVLCFSIGFGKPLWTRISPVDGTEYRIAVIPLGGYVKMLDEREAPVPEEQLPRAFNRQSLSVRTAIVAAGPIANFIFAILAFWLVSMMGETGLQPIVAEVKQDTAAYSAGFQIDDKILAVDQKQTPSWETAVFAILAASIEKDDVSVHVQDVRGMDRMRLLHLANIGDLSASDDPMETVGLMPQRPVIPPIIGELVAGGAAEQGGLQVGDHIVGVDDQVVNDWRELVKYIQKHPNTQVQFDLKRAGGYSSVSLKTRAKKDDQSVGYIGAGVRNYDHLLEQYQVTVQLGPIDAMFASVEKTASLSWLILKMAGRMFSGDASVKNLGGPVTIAQSAGQTASYGFVSFLRFLAGLSISLGVLNLLPIPILDGGHLLFFAIEAVKGSPLSERLQAEGQRIGMIVLLMLMGLAFFVDFSRLLGS
ncbi:RIP metalloprotease RseP [Pseudomonadota bacterium]